jgi:hypothetical protein
MFRPGLWSMEGIYIDEGRRRHRQSGEVVIVHEPGLWTVDASMTISGEDSRTFQSRHEVTPVAPGASFSEWRSETGGPEPIVGLLVVVEDSLMLPWQSSSGIYWGNETLVRLGEGLYQSRGFAFLDRRLVSSWLARLTLQGGR